MKIKVWGIIPINKNQFITLEAIFFFLFFSLTVFFFWYKFPAYIDDPMILFYAKYLKFAALIATFLIVVETQFYLNLFIKEQNNIIEKQNYDLKKQKNEILHQKEELKTQRDFAQQQFEIISAQKKEITESITYASRIQKALLPNNMDIIKEYEYFISYKPREIVSGDFYWFAKKNNQTIIAAADCTGHGVPGAFMSVLGITYLNDIVSNSHSSLSANNILEQLRTKIVSTFKNENSNKNIEDGMDIAIYIIENNKKNIQFAGANNPIFIIKNKNQMQNFEINKKMKISENENYKLIQIKGDAMPIGISRATEKFENHIIPIQKNDTIYVFSDGILDQFGGKYAKRFGSKRFKNLLLDIQSFPMNKQKKIIEEKIFNWMYENKQLNIYQIDDILVFGLKIS
jgi:serine phosphatase RsbU (regulator of sigma subunit)